MRERKIEKKMAKMTKNDKKMTKNDKKCQKMAKNDQICAVFDPRVLMGPKLSISNHKKIALKLATTKTPKTHQKLLRIRRAQSLSSSNTLSKSGSKSHPVPSILWGRPGGRRFDFFSGMQFGNNTLRVNKKSGV